MKDWRYVVAFCFHGRVAEQLRCLKKSLQVTSALQRQMLVPAKGVAVSPGGGATVTWDWALVVDFPRLRNCLANALCGPYPAFPVSEFLSLVQWPNITIPQIRCLLPGPDPRASGCYNPQALKAMQDASGGQIIMPDVNNETAVIMASVNISVQGIPVVDLQREYGERAEILCFGDLTDMPALVYPQPTPSVKLTAECTNLWRPDGAILAFADGIVETLLGPEYAAVHLKVHGASASSSAPGAALRDSSELGAKPVAEMAAAVRQKLQGTHVSAVYLVTDAEGKELQDLIALLKDPKAPGKYFSAVLTTADIVVDEAWLAEQYWSSGAIALERKHKDGVSYGLMDKYMCVRAEHFVGTVGSAVSQDILLTRKLEGLALPGGLEELV